MRFESLNFGACCLETLLSEGHISPWQLRPSGPSYVLSVNSLPSSDNPQGLKNAVLLPDSNP